MLHISVAMATWNGERFIEQQLESIAQQTRLPSELVISDDASDDTTLEIVGDFARRAPFDVRILESSERRGHGETFFAAMKACKGDLLAPSDQDDVWDKEKLAICGRKLEEEPAASMVAHSARIVNEDLDPSTWDWGGYIKRRSQLPPGSFAPFACDRLAGFQLLIRSIFVERGEVDDRPPPPEFMPDQGVRITHDIWANLVCGAMGIVELLPDELALHRRHDTNTSQGTPENTGNLVRRSMALQTEEAAYSTRGASASSRHEYLERLLPFATELGPQALEGLTRTIENHRRYAGAMRRRSLTYKSQRRGKRLTSLVRNAMQGDYRARTAGGLGIHSLARDSTIGLVRTGANSLSV